MVATSETVGLAEWIIDAPVLFFLPPQPRKILLRTTYVVCSKVGISQDQPSQYFWFHSS